MKWYLILFTQILIIVQMCGEIKRVLIVEDDPVQALLLRKVFESINYIVIGIAESGSNAIKMAEDLSPDVIIMDIMLSDDIDGIEAATEIQKKIDVDLIFISGNADPEIMERASKTKYRSFLRKPYNLLDIRNLISSEVNAD